MASTTSTRRAPSTSCTVRRPDAGAGVAALALRALAAVMERARLARLTRSQHVLLRLGELIAHAEGAASLARRAAAASDDKLPENADRRFAAAALAALARVYAREAASKVAGDGARLVIGAGGVDDDDAAGFEAALGGAAIQRAHVAIRNRVRNVRYSGVTSDSQLVRAIRTSSISTYR